MQIWKSVCLQQGFKLISVSYLTRINNSLHGQKVWIQREQQNIPSSRGRNIYKNQGGCETFRECGQYGYKIYALFCGRLYKEKEDYIFCWSGIDPYVNIISLTCYKQDNCQNFPGDDYNEEFNKWLGPIQNDKLRFQTLKDKRKAEKT